MNWSLKGDRFVLEGVPGVSIFTTTRRYLLPDGLPAPVELRDFVERVGHAPAAVVGMEQVHGATIRLVNQVSDAVLPKCDGLVTNQPRVALTLRSADCLPLIAYDPFQRVVGVAHAGWRGVKARIPEQLVGAMERSQVLVGIGPGIGPCCYAVGKEFEEWFGAHLRTRNGTRYLDLGEAATAQLVNAGVPHENIYPAPWCTSCETDNCHSYRRDGAAAGRMLTCAMLT